MSRLIEITGSGSVALDNGEVASIQALGQIAKSDTSMSVLGLKLGENTVAEAKFDTVGRHSFGLQKVYTCTSEEGETLPIEVTGIENTPIVVTII